MRTIILSAAGENLIALLIRFDMVCSILSLSACTRQLLADNSATICLSTVIVRSLITSETNELKLKFNIKLNNKYVLIRFRKILITPVFTAKIEL